MKMTHRFPRTPITAWQMLGAVMLAFSGLASSSLADDSALGLPKKALDNGGSLLVCGGGDLTDDVYAEFVRRAGGAQARIVMIPWAYPFADMDEVRYCYSGWLGMDVASFHFLAAATREQADSAELVQPLEKATGVWIGGGDQERLLQLYAGTRVETALRGVMERGGVIAGTSAGASSVSRVMIRYSRWSRAVVGDGFGLIEKAVIDQHFTERARHTRLLGVLEEHPDLIGLGVDEGTALLIEGNRLQALGSGRVTVCLKKPDDGATAIHLLKPGDTAEVAVAHNESGVVRDLLRQ